MKQHPVNGAVAFLTVDGRAARHLITHRADDNGRCRPCSHTHHVRWPCPTATLALAAQRVVEANAVAHTQPMPVLARERV